MIETYLKNLPNTIATWPLKARFFTAFAAGAICVPAMPPACTWLLLGVGIPLLYILLSSTRSAKTAFFDSWFFAFGYFCFSLMWIGNALLVEGNPFWWLWPLAVAGLPAALAVFYGVCGVMLHLLIKLKSWAGWVAFIAAIGFTEWIRGHIFTGFPWNLYGYAWNDSLTMAQSVALFGTYGLTLLTLAWAMVPALWWCGIGQKKSRAAVSGGLALLALGLFLWGNARLAAHPVDLRSDVTLRVVQPNIPQKDKWSGAKAVDNLKQTMALSQPDDGNATAPTIIIWPETAITERLLLNPDVTNAVQGLLQSYKRPAYLMTGILRSDVSPEGTERYYNSLATYDRSMSRVSIYDKSHLVPFGEYIPYKKFIPLKPVVQFSGFEEGHGPETQAVDGLIKFAPLVCYEIIFPGAVVDPRDQKAELIVNVTNDGWYGDRAGPRQHLAMTRFRAIEEGIPVARSANTGISAVFDSFGRTVASIPLNEAKAINVALPQRIKTTLYGRSGDLPFLIFVICMFCGAAILKRAGR